MAGQIHSADLGLGGKVQQGVWGGSSARGHHLVGRFAQGVVHGRCSGVEQEWGAFDGGVHKSISSSTGAIVATKCIGASLTTDPKLLALVQIVTGAIVLAKGEACSAEAGGPAGRVKAALKVRDDCLC